MSPKDAEAIGIFVFDMIRVNETGKTYEMLIDGLKRHFSGTPGSGACICKQSPKHLHDNSIRWSTPFAKLDLNMVLDHRCPWHGSDAQPKLWGRYKTVELTVTPAQWLSLGVEYPES